MSQFAVAMIVALVALVSTAVSAQEKKTPTILAFGDSITSGGRTFACYREIMVPALEKKGAAYEFVGPNKDSTSAHAGYGGKNTKQLLGISKAVYQKYPADLVLLHSGHNSFSKDKPVPGIIRDTEAIIRNMSEINPKVRILLAQVIPAGKLPKYSYIPELNEALEALAARLSKEGLHVILVDQAKGFDWKTDTVGDKVHPNADGAKKMAARWIAALSPLKAELDKKPAGTTR